jgi:hypothetical protein
MPDDGVLAEDDVKMRRFYFITEGLLVIMLTQKTAISPFY